MWGRAESRGGTEQPISWRREYRWHDSLRRDRPADSFVRDSICPCLGLAAQHSPSKRQPCARGQSSKKKQVSLPDAVQHSPSSSTPSQCSTDQGKGLCSNKRTNQTYSIPLLGPSVGRDGGAGLTQEPFRDSHAINENTSTSAAG
jgi:hypothetical protein